MSMGTYDRTVCVRLVFAGHAWAEVQTDYHKNKEMLVCYYISGLGMQTHCN
jgi:hypothetical protein